MYARVGIDKARALADTLAAYDAGSSGANVEIGGCKRRSAARVDCQNLSVSAGTGAAACESMTAMSKRGGRFFYAHDNAKQSCDRTMAIHSRGRKRVPGAVLRSLSELPVLFRVVPEREAWTAAARANLAAEISELAEH